MPKKYVFTRREFISATVGVAAWAIRGEKLSAQWHHEPEIFPNAEPIRLNISLEPDGKHPGLMAITSDNQYLVIPCQDSDNVLILSIAELKTVGVISLPKGSTPWMAYVLRDARTALVTLSQFTGEISRSLTPSNVAVIDIEQRRLVRYINVGVGPNGLAVDSREQRAYVANTRSNDISVIDLPRWKTIATIKVGRRPFSINFATRELLVVCNFEDASLSFIHTPSLRVVDVVTVGNPKLIVPNPEWGLGDTTWFAAGQDGYGYTTNWRSSEIAVIDLKTRAIVRRMVSPIKHPFEIHARRKRNYLSVASDLDQRLAIFEGQTGNVVEELPMTGTAVAQGPARYYNTWMNDPQSNAMLLFAPKGLENITTLASVGDKML
jgi:YVTN family beta-propeller protein